MIVRCLFNNGTVFKNYEKSPVGVTDITQYGELELNKSYLVMGLIYWEGILYYLIDDSDIISLCPYQLFEVIDNKVSSNWFCRPILDGDVHFPKLEMITGYSELVFDDNHYIDLVEGNETAKRIYFENKKKINTELLG